MFEQTFQVRFHGRIPFQTQLEFDAIKLTCICVNLQTMINSFQVALKSLTIASFEFTRSTQAFTSLNGFFSTHTVYTASKCCISVYSFWDWIGSASSHYYGYSNYKQSNKSGFVIDQMDIFAILYTVFGIGNLEWYYQLITHTLFIYLKTPKIEIFMLLQLIKIMRIN